MPITPLHFGLMAPIRHFTRKVSLTSFILVNVWLDGEAISAWLQNQPLPSHADMDHTFVGAAILAVMMSLPAVLPGLRSLPWVLGAYLGAFSHILLDSMVHPEMNPFWPTEGNPLYMGLMEPLSGGLLPLTIWLIVQIVSGSLGWARSRWVALKARTQEPTALPGESR